MLINLTGLPMDLTFKNLWLGYPEEYTPCHDMDGVPFFENQCAIRMGVTLSRAGLDMSDYTGEYCWYHPESDGHSLRVMELLEYLAEKLPSYPNYMGKTTHYRYDDQVITPDKIAGKTGIVIFINFWGDHNQGDHIDLWDGEELINGDPDYFERSEKVVFFEIT